MSAEAKDTEGVAGRLDRLGIVLPRPTPPLASYVPVQCHGDWVHVSGQLPMVEGKLAHVGRLGQDLAVEDGVAAARACAIMVLAQLATVGPLESFRLIRVGGFVAATPEFTAHPEVINGASDLFLEVLGENGRHARAAVGVASLPRGAAVEVEVLAVRVVAVS
ncbi:MAG: RidA family protein [Candidatus Sericytochromatia bacterium]|nr:RidA family protein [Candidatus Sericytochromatia bacterium]